MLDHWTPTRRNQKRYPHFDAPLSLAEMERIANDPALVASNRFFPFLVFENKFKRFRPADRTKKVRELRYATRRDAAIFSRYRHGLSELYEAELLKRGLTANVIAYRSIPIGPGSSAGKCNIHHAKEAFDKITELGDCHAIIMDISGYFENLDHRRIKALWKGLLGVSELPPDHYAVFKAITQYRVVDREAAYSALGFFGVKKSGVSGFLKPFKEMPKQLCSPKTFRERICGEAKDYPDLVQKNLESGKPAKRGIPQGAPLSDPMANLYLVDFDSEIAAFVEARGGLYLRYSDDILLVLSGLDDSEALKVMASIQKKITEYGDALEIKESKCSVHRFSRSGPTPSHTHIHPTSRSSNGLSYLGFRFDGQRVFLKDATVSAFWRKTATRIRVRAVSLVKRYRDKDLAFLRQQLRPDQILEKIGRVRDFEPKNDRNSRTFWTYVRRADAIFRPHSRIYHQMRGYREKMRNKAQERPTQVYFRSQ